MLRKLPTEWKGKEILECLGGTSLTSNLHKDDVGEKEQEFELKINVMARI